MSKPNPTRLAVFSNQAIYLRGLEQLIMSLSNLQLVGEARTENEITQLCTLIQPEAALLHINDCQYDLLALVERLRHALPHLPIILLAECEVFDRFIAQDDRPGVYFLCNDVSEEEFKTAMIAICADLRAHSGEIVVPAQFRHVLEPDGAEPGETELGHMAPQERSGELITHELAQAGQIQATLLPENIPTLTGWDISAALLPARETSGDFYDFIPMAYDKWGIVVADVTDKGMGAALFMALSSTLIRTYAARFPSLPALTMNAVNERILSDTRGSMFVTTFLLVLEPHTGRMVYANAGHPPGFLLNSRNGKTSIETLRPTGMVLGVSEQASWKQKSIRIAPGDLLVLYSDGITEMQDQQGNFFGEERLLDTLLANQTSSARQVQLALIDAVQKFTGSTARQDDIALVVLRRNG